jgi:hypothetical protein
LTQAKCQCRNVKRHTARVASASYLTFPPVGPINDLWGEFVITPALMMDMDEIILDRISFGGVKELEEIYFD